MDSMASASPAANSDRDAESLCCIPAVTMLSSRMLARSLRSLPRRLAQMVDPMRSFMRGCRPYSFGMTALARAFAI